MVSALSTSDFEFLSSSSCSEESTMEVSGCGSSIEDNNSIPRTATDAAATAINGIENGGTGELVLAVKDEIIKEMASVSTLGDGTRNDNGHVLAWLNNFSQQFKSFFESNNQLKHLGEFNDSIRALSTQMEMLNGQMREMQLLFLKSSLTVPTASPGVCAAIKQENFFLPQDQVFQTPKKLQGPPMRLDVTPVSTNSDTDQKCVDSTLPSNSRRTLTFPKSLEAILDENKESCLRKNNRCTTRDAAIHVGATPTLSLVDCKIEPGTVESPHRDSKLGLLVLADAALARTPEQTGFTRRSGESFPDYYDSGRSSASGNSCRSSPSVNQSVLNVKAGEKYDRYGVYPTNRNIQVSKRLKSEHSSSSSTSYAKLRKRRKTKQPLPCNFCGKCFNNQSSLRQHESFHRPVRPYKCENDKCDKAYKTRSELNRHLVVHSGEKKHECKLCGKRFLRKQYLKTHLLRHHETGIAMVAPSAIDSFKDNSTGTIPSIVVSSSFVSKTEPLTWRCQMCFKIFVDNDDLTRHLRSYHGQEKKKGMDEKIDSSKSAEINRKNESEN